jgi:hypothetical protein
MLSVRAVYVLSPLQLTNGSLHLGVTQESRLDRYGYAPAGGVVRGKPATTSFCAAPSVLNLRVRPSRSVIFSVPETGDGGNYVASFEIVKTP